MISTPNREQKWVHVTLSDGKVITATEGHPFRTAEGWRDAVLLKKGDILILTGSDGKLSTIQVDGIRYETKVLTTYNLEVANAHTFFVGEDGVLVHNCKITSADLRKGSGYSTFKASKENALKQNNGMCQYCQKKPATQGDHIIPLKDYAEKVNRGEMTLEEARLTGNGASNVIGSCGGKGGCNQIKNANELSSTKGTGKFVPPNPTDTVKKLLE